MTGVCACGCGEKIAEARWPSMQARFIHGHNTSPFPNLPDWDPVEIAWAAGLFEGEGCISVQRQKGRRPSPKLNIAMTDLEPLERFARAVGIGNVTGPYRYEGNKPRWSWQIAGRNAVAVLRKPGFLEHLGPRRQAKAAEVLRVCAEAA